MDGGNDSGVMDEGGQKKRAISRHGRPGFLRCVEVGTLGLGRRRCSTGGLPDTRIRLVLSRPFRRETAKGCTARSTKGRLADPGPWLAAGCTYKPMTPWPPPSQVLEAWSRKCMRPSRCAMSPASRPCTTARRAAVVSVRKRRRQALGLY